ncbi:MAG: anthranilate synthase component I family protein [Legionellales bacterium]|nr:anthranilate synthase component I family protein [Legionellales bacterium]
MLQQLTQDEFLALSKTANRVAVYQEIAADRLTPIGIVQNLADEMLDGAILESGLRHEDAGRYSFIAFDSMAQFSVQNNQVSQRIESKVSTPSTPPFIALRQLLSELSCASKQHTAKFVHGGVGLLTYDAIRLFEAIPDRHSSDNILPEVLFNFYRTTLMFDHLQQKLLISVIVETGDNPVQAYLATQEKIKKLITKITAASHQETTHAHPKIKQDTPVDIDLSDEQFMDLVERAKQHIVDGDVFQIVLSRRFSKRYTATPFDIYRTLRRVSPAPYMFYFPTEQGVIIGASPEKLISVYDRKVELNPIAGTRPRTEHSNDEHITTELLNDKKEMAEHMMLVDLARNDLGAVCEPGTVKVSDLSRVRHFSHVSHICSAVTGQLREGLDALDALAAAFPAGTLSGAPKIRAMEIIDELETSKRGMYGGAICRLDYQGNLDSCIAIRMALLKEGIATIRTGAGIVFDSNPKAEADETRHKARSVLEAIALAQEELK